MALWNIGSVSNSVYNIVENIPTSISGAELNNIVERKIAFCESYTGQNVGTENILIQWQGILVNLSAAEVTSLMQLQGADVSSFSLGDWSVNKGKSSNLDAVSERFQEIGMNELKTIGVKQSFYKANG